MREEACVFYNKRYKFEVDEVQSNRSFLQGSGICACFLCPHVYVGTIVLLSPDPVFHIYCPI